MFISSRPAAAVGLSSLGNSFGHWPLIGTAYYFSWLSLVDSRSGLRADNSLGGEHATREIYPHQTLHVQLTVAHVRHNRVPHSDAQGCGVGGVGPMILSRLTR